MAVLLIVDERAKRLKQNKILEAGVGIEPAPTALQASGGLF
jgi:hypothetical protein